MKSQTFVLSQQLDPSLDFTKMLFLQEITSLKGKQIRMLDEEGIKKGAMYKHGKWIHVDMYEERNARITCCKSKHS